MLQKGAAMPHLSFELVAHTTYWMRGFVPKLQAMPPLFGALVKNRSACHGLFQCQTMRLVEAIELAPIARGQLTVCHFLWGQSHKAARRPFQRIIQQFLQQFWAGIFLSQRQSAGHQPSKSLSISRYSIQIQQTFHYIKFWHQKFIRNQYQMVAQPCRHGFWNAIVGLVHESIHWSRHQSWSWLRTCGNQGLTCQVISHTVIHHLEESKQHLQNWLVDGCDSPAWQRPFIKSLPGMPRALEPALTDPKHACPSSSADLLGPKIPTRFDLLSLATIWLWRLFIWRLVILRRSLNFVMWFLLRLEGPK